MFEQQRVVKVCKKHGELTAETCFKSGKYFKCKICVREYKKEYRMLDKWKEYQKEYHNSYNTKEYRKKYLKSSEYKESAKKNSRKSTKELKDSYVKHRLKGNGFSIDAITPELIRIKRLFMRAKRLIKGQVDAKTG